MQYRPDDNQIYLFLLFLDCTTDVGMPMLLSSLYWCYILIRFHWSSLAIMEIEPNEAVSKRKSAEIASNEICSLRV